MLRVGVVAVGLAMMISCATTTSVDEVEDSVLVSSEVLDQRLEPQPFTLSFTPASDDDGTVTIAVRRTLECRQTVQHTFEATVTTTTEVVEDGEGPPFAGSRVCCGVPRNCGLFGHSANVFLTKAFRAGTDVQRRRTTETEENISSKCEEVAPVQGAKVRVFSGKIVGTTDNNGVAVVDLRPMVEGGSGAPTQTVHVLFADETRPFTVTVEKDADGVPTHIALEGAWDERASVPLAPFDSLVAEAAARRREVALQEAESLLKAGKYECFLGSDGDVWTAKMHKACARAINIYTQHVLDLDDDARGLVDYGPKLQAMCDEFKSYGNFSSALRAACFGDAAVILSLEEANDVGTAEKAHDRLVKRALRGKELVGLNDIRRPITTAAIGEKYTAIAELEEQADAWEAKLKRPDRIKDVDAVRAAARDLRTNVLAVTQGRFFSNLRAQVEKIAKKASTIEDDAKRVRDKVRRRRLARETDPHKRFSIYRQHATTVGFSSLAKNPVAWGGEPVVFGGQVLQVIYERGGAGEALIRSTEKYAVNDIIHVSYRYKGRESSIREDAWVLFAGRVYGAFRYVNGAGAVRSVPDTEADEFWAFHAVRGGQRWVLQERETMFFFWLN